MADLGICFCLFILLACAPWRYKVIDSFSFFTGHILSAEIRLLLCTLANLDLFALCPLEPLVRYRTLVNNLFRVSNHYQLSSQISWRVLGFLLEVQALIGRQKFSDLPFLRAITEHRVISECKKEEYDDYRNSALFAMGRLCLPADFG
ncbi:hypothetical protein [Desulfitobacterium hafniense]|uniref:hypothetical protein n=1 Tax=Desulfitobacterium hafniense TaxID=49338 RepID=UPI00128EFA1A|nr:hypothetical protein [Desulfitobacterium hafniense]MEA5024832.1 hypothetical protein [Desulfitobacterium hafniense]